MKFIVSISLHLVLLFVFTTVTTSSAWACGNHKPKKETAKAPSKCAKDCCKIPCSDSKNKKKNCCGDNCTCPVSLTVMADLPKQLLIQAVLIRPVFMVKSVFFYQKTFSKSTVQDIWQPPITVLSV
jgi:hypothetical protein